jgi:hypothetical protein
MIPKQGSNQCLFIMRSNICCQKSLVHQWLDLNAHQCFEFFLKKLLEWYNWGTWKKIMLSFTLVSNYTIIINKLCKLCS